MLVVGELPPGEWHASWAEVVEAFGASEATAEARSRAVVLSSDGEVIFWSGELEGRPGLALADWCRYSGQGPPAPRWNEYATREDSRVQAGSDSVSL